MIPSIISSMDKFLKIYHAEACPGSCKDTSSVSIFNDLVTKLWISSSPITIVKSGTVNDTYPVHDIMGIKISMKRMLIPSAYQSFHCRFVRFQSDDAILVMSSVEPDTTKYRFTTNNENAMSVMASAIQLSGRLEC